MTIPTPKELHNSTLRINALYQKWLHRESTAAQANRDSVIAQQRWLDALTEHQELEAGGVVYEAPESGAN